MRTFLSLKLDKQHEIKANRLGLDLTDKIKVKYDNQSCREKKKKMQCGEKWLT